MVTFQGTVGQKFIGILGERKSPQLITLSLCILWYVSDNCPYQFMPYIFLLLYNILSYNYTKIYLFVLWMDIWIVSRFLF